MEAEVVRGLYNKYVYEGLGAMRIANYLNDLGYKPHSDGLFNTYNINRILKNKTYCGYLITKDEQSDHIEELKIIDKRLFNHAQRIAFRGRLIKNIYKSYK